MKSTKKDKSKLDQSLGNGRALCVLVCVPTILVLAVFGIGYNSLCNGNRHAMMMGFIFYPFGSVTSYRTDQPTIPS